MSETPILDLEMDPPGPRWPWLPGTVGFILGALITCVLILEDQGKLPDWHWPAFNGLLLIPALYVAIATHELGHVAAGKLAGFRTGALAIGGFVFGRSGNHWMFRFDRRTWMCGFYKPLTTVAVAGVSPFGWMVAGGPSASLSLLLVCALAWLWFGNGPWNVLGSLFWVALFILVCCIVPFSSGLTKSDGARLWLLFRHPERARAWIALLEIQTEETNGIRPRDWDAQLFDVAVSVGPEAPEYPHCRLFAFYRHLDQGDQAAALTEMEKALSRSAAAGRPFRHVLFLEAASASAMIRKRPRAARTWRLRACRLRRPDSLDAVKAAMAMCEGRYEDAANYWAAALERAVWRKLDSGLIRFAREKWAEYEAECRAAASAV
ncbi:MAG: hypothetical protein JO108_36665 [Acidobacteriaceae bacterium]|nr:hypothetical protein [Acidobacteriaceae bacterium]